MSPFAISMSPLSCFAMVPLSSSYISPRSAHELTVLACCLAALGLTEVSESPGARGHLIPLGMGVTAANAFEVSLRVAANL